MAKPTPADRSKVTRIITTFLDTNEVQDAIASQWEAMVNSSGITGNELEENPEAVFNALKFQQKIFSNKGKVAPSKCLLSEPTFFIFLTNLFVKTNRISFSWW